MILCACTFVHLRFQLCVCDSITQSLIYTLTDAAVCFVTHSLCHSLFDNLFYNPFDSLFDKWIVNGFL